MEEVMNEKEKEENEKKLILLGYERCDNCKKLCKHLEKSHDKEKNLCGNCKHNEITNKYFIPKKFRINNGKSLRIGKFTISSQEELVLWRKYVREGSTYYGAWCKVRGRKKQLQNVKFRKMKENWKRKQEQRIKMKQDINNSKKFLKGLGFKKRKTKIRTKSKQKKLVEGLKTYK